MVRTRIAGKTDVGKNNVAISLNTPPGFEAHPGQFIQLQADIDDEEISRYYTISSPRVADTFEITVEVDSDGTLSPWLYDRQVGEHVTIVGAFGDIRYRGTQDVAILASGPGIGPAVGIAERAQMEGSSALIIHNEETPVHQSRLQTLEQDGGTVSYAPEDDDVDGDGRYGSGIGAELTADGVVPVRAIVENGIGERLRVVVDGDVVAETQIKSTQFSFETTVDVSTPPSQSFTWVRAEVLDHDPRVYRAITSPIYFT